MAKVAAHNRPQSAKSQRKVSCSAADVKNHGTRNGYPFFYFLHADPSPLAVEICGKKMVQEIVAARDRPEHVANFARFIALSP
jgi:hypothetical protein